MSLTIPRISMAEWRSDAASRKGMARRFVEQLHEIGFFTVVDHGIDEAFIEQYFSALTEFFALPEEVKARIEKVRSPHFRGWERIGSELTDNKIDYREQLDLLTEYPAYPSDVQPEYLRLDGPNQWLDDDILPGFRPLVESFIAQVSALANELMSIIAIGLGLAEDTFTIRFGERPLSLTKLISYPPTPVGMAGVNVHNDAGFLTLVLQNGVPGLEVLTPGGEFVVVPPERGTFAMNIGEMLQTMTGNYLVATKHRVINDEHRYSSAYFHGPDLRAELTMLELAPEFADAVAASDRHRSAGFMAKRDELLAGDGGINSAPVLQYGQMMWNYYVRSYPDIVLSNYPDVTV